MGRSFRRIGGAPRVEDFATKNTLYNKASDRYYAMTERKGSLYEQRHQVGFEGKPTNFQEMRIDYVIGSGDHAHTYLHRTDEGKLLELPVSWYSENGGHWGMSPGYDSASQQGFRRAVNFECLSCHDAYPAADQVSLESPDKNIFGTTLPEGIDCQRCHGPGAEHVRLAQKQSATLAAIRAAIVNPARLPRARQMDACMQCHLETTSSTLPHSLRKVDRASFSYRPGEPLQDFEFFFDYKPGTDFDDRFEVVHQAYQLAKSVCFQKSQMTCITCHDPHVELHGEAATQHFVAVCKSCHANVHASGVPALAGVQRSGANCLTCHMWKRRTNDAVHVVLTDHYIQRLRPDRDFLASLKESNPVYRGEVVSYYPQSLQGLPGEELYMALAQTEDGSNLQAGTIRLRAAIDKLHPTDAAFYFAMGAAYAKEGKNAEAVPFFEEALRRHPRYQQALRALAADFAAEGNLARAATVGEQAAATAHPDTTVLTDLAGVYLRLDRLIDAKAALQQALAIDPNLPAAEVLLGIVYAREGNLPAAQAADEAAIALQPESLEANNNLAGLLATARNYTEAAFYLKRAAAVAPEDPQIRRNYAALLADTGSPAKAIEQMREAVRLDPASASLQVDLGNLLSRQGDPIAAEAAYRDALVRDPANAEANLNIAQLLLHRGESSAARPYLQKAAQSADPKLRQTALQALARSGP
jgi:Flp pilus assembly protein TadD